MASMRWQVAIKQRKAGTYLRVGSISLKKFWPGKKSQRGWVASTSVEVVGYNCKVKHGKVKILTKVHNSKVERSGPEKIPAGLGHFHFSGSGRSTNEK